MNTTREKLMNTVDYAIKKKLKFKNYVTMTRDISVTINKEYNIPIEITTDYLSRRKTLDDASLFMLFALLNKLDPDKAITIFTDKEYKKYQNYKYKPETIKFPLELPAVEIAEDQWMCVIDAKTLMKLRDAQLVEYNENTQRTLTRVVSSGIETYKITLNRKAVEGIKNSYTHGTYIPNTITLNMPEGTDYDYRIGKNGPSLIIDNIDHFDILDGYHRYIAISEIYNNDPSFDYAMELRIVSFREEKARQFIWQEDQKTKMSKIDSESFNQYKASNAIVKRIESGPLAGIIKSKGGIIESALLATILDHTYLKDIRKLVRSDEARIARRLEDGFMKLEESNTHVFDDKWSREFTVCAVFCFWRGHYDAKEILEFTDYAGDRISQRINGKDIMRLKNAWDEYTEIHNV